MGDSDSDPSTIGDAELSERAQALALMTQQFVGDIKSQTLRLTNSVSKLKELPQLKKGYKSKGQSRPGGGVEEV